MNRFAPLLRAALVIALFAVAACGSTNGSGSATAGTVTLSGTVSESLSVVKPWVRRLAGISPLAGGTVEVIDSTGVVLATTTILDDGSYSVTVAAGTNYFIRAVKGNVCLKAFAGTVNASTNVNITPTSTATVMILGEKLGNHNLGEEGQDLSTALAANDTGTLLTAIEDSQNHLAVATAIANDISANADYAAATAAVGASSATVAQFVAAASVSISVDVAGVSVPAAPGTLTATAGNQQVTITWGAVSGASTYSVYWGTAAGVTTASTSKATAVTATSYTATGLANDTAYYFIVTALNGAGESAASEEISATPAPAATSAPTADAAVVGDTRVTLRWAAPADGAPDSYNIYYIAGSTVAPGAAGATKISAISGSATSYVVDGLTNGTQYAFVVVGKTGVLEGETTAVITATPNGAWSTKASMAFQRDNPAIAVANGKIYMFAGAPAGIGVLDSVEEYDPAANAWTTKAVMPAARYGPTAATLDGKIYVIGGTTAVNGSGPILTIALFDPVANTWSTNMPGTATPIADLPAASGRWGHDAVTVDGKIYVVGGALRDPGTLVNTYFDNVDIYDPATNSWSAGAAMPTPRQGMTVSVVNGKIYAIGGWNEGIGELAMVEVYDIAANTWSTVNPATNTAYTPMPHPRDDFGFGVVDGLIYAIGGDLGMWNDGTYTYCCTDIVEVYDPVKDEWTTRESMPTVRDDFDTAVIDGVIYNAAGSRDLVDPAPPALPGPPVGHPLRGGYSLVDLEVYSVTGVPVPGAASATAGAGSVTVTWNAVAGATSYNIYWSTLPGVTTASGTRITGVTSPYTHTGRTAGTWYHYVVTAVTANGESVPCSEVAAKAQ